MGRVSVRPYPWDILAAECDGWGDDPLATQKTQSPHGKVLSPTATPGLARRFVAAAAELTGEVSPVAPHHPVPHYLYAPGSSWR
jgi:hypothetical protein